MIQQKLIKFDKVNHPKATVLIWESKKIVVLGVKSEKQCIDALNTFSKGTNIDVLNLKLRNVVISGSLGTVNLYAIGKHVKHIYEAEIFPGMQLEFQGKKAVVFWSGKFFITGCKSVEDATQTKAEFVDWIKSLNNN